MIKLILVGALGAVIGGIIVVVVINSAIMRAFRR